MQGEYFEADPWKIIEREFRPETKRFSESIFSLGNEHMGLRGFFEEDYSGDSFQGTYLAGVYYPDPTKVGWWKNGYPEFFAKVINSCNWAGLRVLVDGEAIDLNHVRFDDYRCELDMRRGLLTRSYIWTSRDGRSFTISFQRFLSMAQSELALVRCEIRSLGSAAEIELVPYLDGAVCNEDSHTGQAFWEPLASGLDHNTPYLSAVSKKTAFETVTAMATELWLEALPAQQAEVHSRAEEQRVETSYRLRLPAGKTLSLQKYVCVATSRDHAKERLLGHALTQVKAAQTAGWERLFREHATAWEEKWAAADVVIAGDVKAQQGIRYNIFQLLQTYSGRDPRLNIGPKGFTGEKYGGCTYWDTEAFCLPFYLYTQPEVAKTLLQYRYEHLERAKENARKLHLDGALYPMVTIDGRECHNEWEITFEEIHRNGAIAYAIYHYTSYTGDRSYLEQQGLEVLVELSRFWASRVSYSKTREQYVILGVTGPNEYENNVNNNWYTNMLAQWTLSYTSQELERVRAEQPLRYAALQEKLGLRPEEFARWQELRQKIYLPFDKELGLPLQQDGYRDKEDKLVADLLPGDYPLCKNWSWDHILRSPYIKQADVLQGYYFFPQLHDKETIRRAFDYYEPRTVHESSLSPSVHAIVASFVGYHDKAYELYLRTARLDLDNYNHDTEDGCHITSMVGSWLSIVQGFAGLRFEDDRLSFTPHLPKQWQALSFQFHYRDRGFELQLDGQGLHLQQKSGEPLKLEVWGEEYRSVAGETLHVPHSARS